MFGHVWERLTGGLWVPSGTQTYVSSKNSRTYLTVKENVTAVCALYEANAIKIPQDSSLANFLECGRKLSDGWLLGGGAKLSNADLFRGAVCSRIVESILVLGDAPKDVAKLYLGKLLRGSLDLLDRIDSEAKNFLWELELLLALRAHKMKADLGEPDVVTQMKFGKVGFACKKIYSEKNISKVFSQAVAQITRTGMPGILAINLDESVPPNAILRLKTFDQLRNYCSQNNDRFLQDHKDSVEKYCCSGRAIAVWVSTGLIADLTAEQPRITNARESAFWSSTQMEPTQREIVTSFLTEFQGGAQSNPQQ
jgi:hypothetical protein